MKGFIDEFKTFAMKGNVVDLAIAVVVGSAFGKIVASLVDNIVMPIIGILLGGISFSGLSYALGDSVITYGIFIQSVIDFLIISLVIFMVVKVINKTKETFISGDEEVVIEKPIEVSEEVMILREIRDSLRQ